MQAEITPFNMQNAVHGLAVEKGWWDAKEGEPEEKSKRALLYVEEKLALVHSELSEALECYRDGEPLGVVHYGKPTPEEWRFVEHGVATTGAVLNALLADNKHLGKPIPGHEKPEGFVVELADAAIRVFDLAGALGFSLDEPLSLFMEFAQHAKLEPAVRVTDELARIHGSVSKAGSAFLTGNHGQPLGQPVTRKVSDSPIVGGRPAVVPAGFAFALAEVVVRCDKLAQGVGGELWEAMRIKHEYNATRPHRHGGKKA